ncbi:hypothetical protein GCM10011415_42270 [Salipiger pallidus]|uniref:Uncharacterized protein n=1 Tax=Salipiger pallidus TaxID=1775170 RepID=A0A8J2ZNT0_9RHOB|nr:hypothetical protein GCM10011415_42270 [Salipiger pallidus]
MQGAALPCHHGSGCYDRAGILPPGLESVSMSFRIRILWLATLIALAAAAGLLPRPSSESPQPIPRAPAFRL